MCIRDRLLTSYKYPGDKTPIVKGSALAAVEKRDEEIGKNSILELMKAVDEHIPQPAREVAVSYTHLTLPTIYSV